jgi:hypothetical protein
MRIHGRNLLRSSLRNERFGEPLARGDTLVHVVQFFPSLLNTEISPSERRWIRSSSNRRNDATSVLKRPWIPYRLSSVVRSCDESDQWTRNQK